MDVDRGVVGDDLELAVTEEGEALGVVTRLGGLDEPAEVDRRVGPLVREVERTRALDREAARHLARGRHVDAHLEAPALDGRGAVGRLVQELGRGGGLHDGGVVAAAVAARGDAEHGEGGGGRDGDEGQEWLAGHEVLLASLRSKAHCSGEAGGTLEERMLVL